MRRRVRREVLFLMEAAALGGLVLLKFLSPLLFAGRHPVWRVLRVMLVAGAVVWSPWPTLTRESAAWSAAIAVLAVLGGFALWRRASRLGAAEDVRGIVALSRDSDANTIIAGVGIMWAIGWATSDREDRKPGLVLALVVAGLVGAFGLWVLVLGFFAVWCVVWMAAWAVDPAALAGMGSQPTVGDFLYVSVGALFGSPPADIVPSGGVGHAVLVMEVIGGAAAVTAFAGRFLAARDGPTPTATSDKSDASPKSSQTRGD